MTILVVAEHDNQKLKASTLSVLSAAKLLTGPIKVLVAGKDCAAVAEQLRPFADEVLLADHPVYEHSLPESMAPLILSLADSVTHILAGATSFGKCVLPRVAAILGVAQISDVREIVDQQTYVRSIYAGRILVTVRSKDKQQVLTVRTSAFPPPDKRSDLAQLTPLNFVAKNAHSRFICDEKRSSIRPELTEAECVIAGGRGLQNEGFFKRLTGIADRLGAAIGASRAAVDAGFAPNDYQIGQTGKVVAPKLYIAVGISGAIQHLAGIKESRVIVAINKDPAAPIFQVADYALIGDLNEVLPEWEAWLADNHY